MSRRHSSSITSRPGQRSRAGASLPGGDTADAPHAHTGAQIHAVRFVQRREVRSDQGTENVAERDVQRLEDGDATSEPCARGGHLGPDEAGADDDDPGLVDRGDGGAQGERVVEGAQREQPVALAEALGSRQGARAARRS